MTTDTHYLLTERDIYYLGSIDRCIGEVEIARVGDPVTTEYLTHLRSVMIRLDDARRGIEGPSLADEIMSDNHDWLDCLIDMVERR